MSSSEGDFLSWSFAAPVVDVGFMFPSASGTFVVKASNSSLAFLESELPGCAVAATAEDKDC